MTEDVLKPPKHHVNSSTKIN